MQDLVIIGAGPAGLTAALYAGRAGLDTLLLEKMLVGGRILASDIIENYPGFPAGITTQELMKRMQDQLEGLPVKIVNEEVVGLDAGGLKVKTGSGTYQAKAVIIATGAVSRKLGVAGEDRLTGKGVSYCAVCDAPFFKNKKVMVVGGGNTVAEEALYLARFASSVGIIHRRGEMRASHLLQKRLQEKSDKIDFILNSVVEEINGTGRVESVRVKNLLTAKESIIACNGIFVFIGYDPDTAIFKGEVVLDDAGFVEAGEDMSTSAPGVFVCGDCRKKSLYQVITACSEGAVAAEAAYKYVTARSVK